MSGFQLAPIPSHALGSLTYCGILHRHSTTASRAGILEQWGVLDALWEDSVLLVPPARGLEGCDLLFIHLRAHLRIDEMDVLAIPFRASMPLFEDSFWPGTHAAAS